jgi:hypothetical protein
MGMYDDFIQELKKEFPNVHVVLKTNWFWKLLAKLLYVVTFGKNKVFLTDYVTTIGPYIGVPVTWPDRADNSRVFVLKHERIHLRQQKKLGLGSIWVGLVPWGISYLLLPLPLGFAWCRYYYERAAYAESIRVARELWGEISAKNVLENAVHELSGPAYAWAWCIKSSVQKWFENNSK